MQQMEPLLGAALFGTWRRVSALQRACVAWLHYVFASNAA